MFDNIFFSRKSCRLWDSVGKYDRAWHDTRDNVMGRRKDAISMPYNQCKNTDTHNTKYLLLYNWFRLMSQMFTLLLPLTFSMMKSVSCKPFKIIFVFCQGVWLQISGETFMDVIIANGDFKLLVVLNGLLRLTSVYIIARLPSAVLSVCPSRCAFHKLFFVEKTGQ
jgi:hypothetical protein